METVGAGTRAPLLGEVLPVELMNTVWADRDRVHDALADHAAALAWLRAVRARLDPCPPVVDDWLAAAEPDDAGPVTEELRALRDALRALAAEVTADPRAAAARRTGDPDRGPDGNPDRDTADSDTADRDTALEVLRRSCAAAPSWSSLVWPAGGVPERARETAGPAGRAVVSLLAEQAIGVLAGELRPALRACLAPGCVLYFVKQHPRREWCSPGCGNRARVARHYRRHRA